MTTAYGEHINIQKKHHVYRKKTENTRSAYKLMTVKKQRTRKDHLYNMYLQMGS